MQTTLGSLLLAASTLGVLMGVPAAAGAHLMVAQYGTLNVRSNGTYAMVALPVSAFPGLDDDGDGRCSAAELSRHQSELVTQGIGGLQLFDETGPLALEGVLFNLSAVHGTEATAEHVVMMGRFAPSAETSDYRLRTSLFGTNSGQDSLHLKVTRGEESQLLVLSPDQPEALLFPGAWTAFKAQVRSGAEHVVFGLDHLLFLLVVLIGGYKARQVLLTLSAFTVGHAVTLGGTWALGWQAPGAVVEPAIALTIILVALTDAYGRRTGHHLSAAQRLTLVFGCALIHGLGLAGALGDLGLEGGALWAALASFNVGVEVAQIAIAMLALALLQGVRALGGARAFAATMQAGTGVAVIAGSFWFVTRMWA